MRALVLVAQSQASQPFKLSSKISKPPPLSKTHSINLVMSRLQLRSDGLVTEALLRTAMSNRSQTACPCLLLFPVVMRVDTHVFPFSQQDCSDAAFGRSGLFRHAWLEACDVVLTATSNVWQALTTWYLLLLRCMRPQLHTNRS